LLAPRPNPKSENHPFYIRSYQGYLEAVSSIRVTMTRRPVMTRIHVTQPTFINYMKLLRQRVKASPEDSVSSWRDLPRLHHQSLASFPPLGSCYNTSLFYA